MRTFVLAAAILATLSLIGFSKPASAGPPLSYATIDRDYSTDSCRTRAKAAFLSMGWTNVQSSGQPSLSISADNDKVSAVIICLGGRYLNPDFGSLVVIVVAGGRDDIASNARDQLVNYMKRWE
jgi:hypothetical protein